MYFKFVENVRKSPQENPSHLPPKMWDGKTFRPTYPGGTDLWLTGNAAQLPPRMPQ
jgi:hypothetical protein